MKIIFSILFLSLTSCITVRSADVIQSKNGTHTLRMNTGTHGESAYKDNFKKTATEICGGEEKYEVLEKAFKPSTLKTNDYSDYHFNWVIKCKK